MLAISSANKASSLNDERPECVDFGHWSPNHHQHQELNKFKERNKALRSEVEELRTMNAYLQSKNATLIDENKRLEKQKAKHDNVVSLR